jgi:hypothetical protein
MRGHAPVFALFFLSPLVAEFLSGTTLPIYLLFLIMPLFLYYGSGGLLIRDVTRRTGRGWPTILTLGWRSASWGRACSRSRRSGIGGLSG